MHGVSAIILNNIIIQASADKNYTLNREKNYSFI